MVPPRAVVVVLCLLAAGAEAASGDDGILIKARLVKAKDDYEAEKAAIQKSLLELFDKRETNAREKGDKKLVDQIKAERQTFEERGEAPKWTPLAIQRRMAVARDTMILAFQTAIKEYLKAKKDDQAALAEKELKLFQEAGVKPPPNPDPPPPQPAADLLQVGTLWTGTRVATNNIPWTLRVQQRDGNRFAGEITIDKTRTYAVVGTVDKGRISFATEKKAKFQQVCDGQIKGEEITLTFTGIDIKGDPVRGTAKLTLKK